VIHWHLHIQSINHHSYVGHWNYHDHPHLVWTRAIVLFDTIDICYHELGTGDLINRCVATFSENDTIIGEVTSPTTTSLSSIPIGSAACHYVRCVFSGLRTFIFVYYMNLSVMAFLLFSTVLAFWSILRHYWRMSLSPITMHHDLYVVLYGMMNNRYGPNG
jgi:hypothetical protein